jgi:hypothetical protein
MIEKSQKNKPQRWDVCSFRVIIWFLRVVCRRPRALTQRHSFYIFPLDGREDGRESPQEDKGDRKNNKWENGFSQSYLGENKFGSSFSICMYISKHVGSFPFFSPVRSNSHTHTEISRRRRSPGPWNDLIHSSIFVAVVPSDTHTQVY